MAKRMRIRRAKTKPDFDRSVRTSPSPTSSLMTRSLRSVLAALLVAVFAVWSAAGAAQTLPAAPPSGTPATPAATPSETQEQLTARVDALAGKLADVEKQLDKVDVNEATLDRIGVDMAPLALEAQTLVDRLAPRVTALKARVDQLGPKTDKESADVAAARDTLLKTYDGADGLLKRAKLLEVNAQQDTTWAAKRQRALFTISLFQRSASLLSPQLWRKVAAETPGNISDTTRVVQAWLTGFNDGLTGGKLVTFWVLVLGVLVLYWPLTRLAKRFVNRESKIERPDTWHKIIAACWTSASVAGAMIAVMYGVVYVFSFFAAPDPRVMPLFAAMQAGVVRIAVAAGLARGILAPGKSRWRLLNLDDTTADKLIRIAVGVAIIVSGAKVIEALNDVIYASLEFSVAARGVGALLVAAALTAAMVDLGAGPEAENPDHEVSATQAASGGSQRRDWYGLIRAGTWALILLLVVAVLVGFSPFASFLVDQIVLVAGTLALLFLLVRLVDKACELGFKPGSPFGRNLIYTVGMRRETLGQLSILLSGAARVALIGLAMLIVAAPWGMQSTDISGNLSAIFFGFKVGDVTISVEGIVIAIVSFLVVLAVTRGVQNWLEDRYLPQTRLDSGLRNSIKTSLGYVGVILALSVAAANLGVDFQKLAIVAGALSVGIGFGLQSIVNNFVSGLILLWERAVRVGDWVVVGSDQGYVRKINVRSTEIETFDRAAVIVPNSNLVSGVVKNLMRADKVGRLSIEVTVHSSADPEKVRETLVDIARDNDSVSSFPAPQVRFTDLKAGAMTFELFCFVSDVESIARTKSDLYFELYKQFKAAKFFDGPAPAPTGIDIIGLDRLEAVLKESRAQLNAPERPAPPARKAS